MKTTRQRISDAPDIAPGLDRHALKRKSDRQRTHKRCGVVECYNRHDEVYLTTVYLLERLGYEVEVLNTWRNRIKNSFVHAPRHRPKIESAFGMKGVLSDAERKRFDVVVFNTLEGAEVLECANRISAHTPVLGFVHNGSFVNSRPQYGDLLDGHHCKLMVLAPYIAEHFAAVATAGCMYPVFFHDSEVPKIASSPGRKRFCVQGYFDAKRRHYDALLDALQALKAEGRDDFEVWIMGRSFSKDFRAFHGRVKRLGLARFVRYTWKGIGYRSYYKLLNSVDFILPLISPASHPVYFRSKSTSSLAAAVGFGKIPIVHRCLAERYGLSDVCLTYDEDMVNVLRAALSADEKKLRHLRRGLEMNQELLLEQSCRQLEDAINEASSGASSAAGE